MPTASAAACAWEWVCRSTWKRAIWVFPSSAKADPSIRRLPPRSLGSHRPCTVVAGDMEYHLKGRRSLHKKAGCIPALFLRFKTAISLQRSKRRVVIRFMRNFAHQFGVQHLVMLVEHHDRTRRQAGQRTRCERHAVVLEEVVPAHGRQRDDIAQAFRTAETRLGERQVGG